MTDARRGPSRPGETLESLLRRTDELNARVLGQLLCLAMIVDPHSPVVGMLLDELRQIARDDALAGQSLFGVVPGCHCRLCAFRRSPFAQLNSTRR